MKESTSSPRSGKKALNLSISAELLKVARSKKINLSAALETALESELGRIRRAEWLERHSFAMKAYNADIEEHGAFSDGLRTF